MPRFRGPFNKQHGKRTQAQLKSTPQQSYHIHWSLPNESRWKKSHFLTCKILILLVNTLAVHEKYPVLNRDNLTIPIQMQLSQQQKPFLHFSLHFWNLAEISNILKKKDDARRFCISEITDSENVVI